ncbi:MAG: hypothetical protein HYU64_08225 [Armatimonadetes bacterium]|nr:hypothetical protein [Armatimonadota bacterium]
MTMTTSQLIQDYNTLRDAAFAKQKSAKIQLNTLRQVDIASAQVDQDPTTTDTITVHSWNGSFSSPSATLTFSEKSENEGTAGQSRQILEFEQVVPAAPWRIGSQEERSFVKLDLNTQEILERQGDFDIIAGNVISTPVSPFKPQAPGKAILEEYRTLRDALDHGQPVPLPGTVEVLACSEKRIQISHWDGCFSSSAKTKTYEATSQDGKAVLSYTETTPAAPWIMGSQDVTIKHVIDMATGEFVG